MIRRMWMPTAGVLAFAFALGAAATACAQDAAPPQARVTADDLNLRSAQGRATLNQRVRKAADAVCDQGGGVRDLATTAAESRCRTDAMRSGAAQSATLAARQEAAARAERVAAARAAVARHAPRRRRVRHLSRHRRHVVHPAAARR